MHVYEIFAQDKWQLKPGHDAEPGPALRPRDHAARGGSGQSAVQRSVEVSGRQEQHLAAARLHLESGRRGKIGACAPATASSTTRRCSAPSTTSSPTPSTRRRSRRTSRAVGPDLGPRNGQFPTDPALLHQPRRSADAGGARLINALYPPGTQRAQHRHGHVGRSRTRAAVLPSDQRRLRARSLPGRGGVGGLRPHAGTRHVPQPEPEHPDRHQHARDGPRTFTDPYRDPERQPRTRRSGRTTTSSACAPRSTATAPTTR